MTFIVILPQFTAHVGRFYALCSQGPELEKYKELRDAALGILFFMLGELNSRKRSRNLLEQRRNSDVSTFVRKVTKSFKVEND